MNAWDQSTTACPSTDCDGTAVAKTNQWGEITHYECRECDREIDAGDGR